MGVGRGGGKRHVTPPKALKGGVRGGNLGGGVRGGKSLRLLSNFFSSFCNNISPSII